MKTISVIRLGHRPQRDKRVTTHVCLVARAFGASKVFITVKDSNLKETIDKVTEKFGNDFKLEFCSNWKKLLSEWNGIKIHLTMYGEHINEVIDKISSEENIIVIVGAEKVPAELYQLADFTLT